MNEPDSPLSPDLEGERSTGFRARAIAWLVRRRVTISLVTFTALVAEDVFEGLKPHGVLAWSDPHTLAGLALIAVGLAVRSWAAGVLRKSAEVSAAGPYSIVRHPLYVGSFLMMLGFCALIDDAENIWFVVGPLALLYTLAVQTEEQKLSALFGAQWQSYATHVPRFIPRSWPAAPWRGWAISQWRANHEYRALGASLLGLTALELWRHA